MPQSQSVRVLTIKPLLVLIALAACIFTFQESLAEENDGVEAIRKMSSLPWVAGPNEGVISGKATIKFGADYKFLGATATKQFLELMGNLPTDNHFTLSKKDYSWFAVFSFADSGYIKDDETINADELLEQLKKGNASANEERKRHGLHVLYLEGWFVPPRYDQDTKRLEWGTRIRSEGASTADIVNYSTRILGRTGVMHATLVSAPEELQKDVVEFKAALRKFSFNPGEKYSEFRQGDKVAEYGLAALIVGGAAAAAAKSGAGKALFKFIGIAIVLGIAAIAAFLKRIMGKN